MMLKQILVAVAAVALSVHATPLAAVDITNTALALELARSQEASVDAQGLTKRGACDQGDCPDFNAGFDFFAQRYVNAVNGQPIVYWGYWGRYNDCGQCSKIITSSDGCFSFTSCGRKQSICVDTKKFRAHRIWQDVNHKTCYSIAAAYYGNCGVVLTNSNVYHPTGEVACNW